MRRISVRAFVPQAFIRQAFTRLAIAAAALAALAISARAAPAQATITLATVETDPALVAGMRLRARVGPRIVSGRLAEARGDTLLLTTGPFGLVPVRLPLAAASRLEHRLGTGSRWRGAARGGAIGVVAGLFIGVVIVDAFHGDLGDVGPVSGYFLPTTVAVGAVARALLPGSRWGPVRIAARVP